jgi:hypothetical protein
MAVSYLKGEPLELRWRSSWCEHQARTIPSLFQSQAETLGDSTLYLVKREGAYQPFHGRPLGAMWRRSPPP